MKAPFLFEAYLEVLPTEWAVVRHWEWLVGSISESTALSLQLRHCRGRSAHTQPPPPLPTPHPRPPPGGGRSGLSTAPTFSGIPISVAFGQVSQKQVMFLLPQRLFILTSRLVAVTCPLRSPPIPKYTDIQNLSWNDLKVSIFQIVK